MAMSEKFKKLCILYILFLWIGWYNQAETWVGIAFAKKSTRGQAAKR